MYNCSIYICTTIFDDTIIIHVTFDTIQCTWIFLVHIGPQCTCNKGNIFNDHSLAFHNKDIFQITQAFTDDIQSCSKVTMIVFMVTHNVDNIRETLRTFLKEFMIHFRLIATVHHNTSSITKFIQINSNKNITGQD